MSGRAVQPGFSPYGYETLLIGHISFSGAIRSGRLVSIQLIRIMLFEQHTF